MSFEIGDYVQTTLQGIKGVIVDTSLSVGGSLCYYVHHKKEFIHGVKHPIVSNCTLFHPTYLRVIKKYKRKGVLIEKIKLI